MGDILVKKLKTTDWILIVLSAASLIGCIVEYQRRYRFLYFCLPLIFTIFFLLSRRTDMGRKKLLKTVALFMATMFAIFCSIVFALSSTPIGEVRNKGSENFLLGQVQEHFEQLSIPSMSGYTRGWLYKQSEKKAPLVIFFNGAGECSAKTVQKFWEEGILSEYFPGCHFMCTDYPSYGVSDGYVSEASMKEMALDTYDTAIQWDFIDKSNITVIGYSIGTGPAAYLAAHRELSHLVMLAPYDEHWENWLRNNEAAAQRKGIKNEGKFKSSVERLFLRLLWGYNVDPIDYAGSIEEPVLIIASMVDTAITHEASMRVAEKLKNCEILTLTDIKHENLLCDTSYEAIHEFIY